jgi:hypothetical protein
VVLVAALAAHQLHRRGRLRRAAVGVLLAAAVTWTFLFRG